MSAEDQAILTVVYTLKIADIWKTSRHQRADDAQSASNRWSLQLLRGALENDRIYQHPDQAARIRRVALLDSQVCGAGSTRYRAGSIALISDDDVAVFSAALVTPPQAGVLLGLLAGSRPDLGRYRCNELPLPDAPPQNNSGTCANIFAFFLRVLAHFCQEFHTPWPTSRKRQWKRTVDYYPYLSIHDVSERYVADVRTFVAEGELVAFLSGEEKHTTSLQEAWLKQHLGPNLAHTRSREFYATDQGAIYLLGPSETQSGLAVAAQPLQPSGGRATTALPSQGSSRGATADGMQWGSPTEAQLADPPTLLQDRATAVLTFIEVFRAQVVLLREIDRDIDALLRGGLREAGLEEIIQFYVATMRALVRYENSTVQTTAWRRRTWDHLRTTYLAGQLAQLSFKLERIERILDMFDRLRVQWFLVTLSLILGVLAIVPNTQWSLINKFMITTATSVVLVLGMWQFHSWFWRRRVFKSDVEADRPAVG